MATAVVERVCEKRCSADTTRTRRLTTATKYDNIRELTCEDTNMAPIEKTTFLSVRATVGLRKACEVAAKRSHLTLPDWVRAVLARAANEGAFAPRKGGRKDGRKR